eukprot:s1267_g32.t1
MEVAAAGATGGNVQTTEVVVTQLQAAIPIKDYGLATTLGEIVSKARSSATDTTVIERIEVARLEAMALHHGLNIYLATTHNLLDTIPVEGCGDLSIAELKMKLSERHPMMCSTRTQLLYRYNVLQDEERISDYPEMMEEGVLCVESPARFPTRTEGLMLHHALADRDKDLVLQMLREGIDAGPLVSSDDGSTHNLLQAALVGDFTYKGQTAENDPYPQLTNILIEARAEVNLIDDSGITPLL